MLHIHIDTARLCTTLATVEAVQLKGLALLQAEGQPPDLHAIPRETLREAALELIAYTDNCARVMQCLRDVPPVPLTAFPVMEWTL